MACSLERKRLRRLRTLRRRSISMSPTITSPESSRMTGADLTRRLLQHRMCVNPKLLDVACTLPTDALHQSMAIGQGSVWKSLVHLYAAEFVWLESLLGDENPLTRGDVRGKLPGNQEGPDK